MTGNAKAVWSVVLGVLSTATMPVAIVGTRYSGSYDLLHAGFAIPIAVVLGAAAIVVARRARARDEMTLGRAGGRRSGPCRPVARDPRDLPRRVRCGRARRLRHAARRRLISIWRSHPLYR